MQKSVWDKLIHFNLIIKLSHLLFFKSTEPRNIFVRISLPMRATFYVTGGHFNASVTPNVTKLKCEKCLLTKKKNAK